MAVPPTTPIVTLQAYKWEVDEPFEKNKIDIYIHGLTKNQESVTIKISDFEPFVYLELDPTIKWNPLRVKQVKEWLKKNLQEPCDPVKCVYQKKRFLYYSAERDCLLLHFRTHSNAIKYGLKKLIEKSNWADDDDDKSSKKSSDGIIPKDLEIDGFDKKLNFKVHGWRADPILQLHAVTGIKPSGWIDVLPTGDGDNGSDKPRKFSLSDIELTCSYKDLVANTVEKSVINPKFASYDIECISGEDPTGDTFPNPKNKHDIVICISVLLGKVFDAENTHQMYCLVNEQFDKKCPHVDDGSIIVRFANETELYKGWTEFMRAKNPDIIISYNGLSFDDNYIFERSKVLMPPQKNNINNNDPKRRKTNVGNANGNANGNAANNAGEKTPKMEYWNGKHFGNFGKLLYQPTRKTSMEWSSSAYSAQSFKYLDIPGRLHIDMYPVISKEYQNLSSYTLNSVSEHFLKEHKIDLPPSVMIRSWHGGDPDDIGKIVLYCNQDTRLPYRLMKKLISWISLIEMSNVSLVPIFDLITRGQQVKMHAQLYCLAYSKGIVVDDRWSHYKPGDDDKKFMGATVQNPQTGYWENVVTFDFKSLYPTTIIAYNLCPHSAIPDGVNPPEGTYHDLRWEDHCGCEHDTTIRKTKPKHKLCRPHHYRFYKAEYIQGIIPEFLKYLLDARAATREHAEHIKATLKSNPNLSSQEKADLELQYTVYDRRQNSFKVSANSVYGGLGSDYSYTPYYPAAGATTAMGRLNIQRAIDKAKELRPDTFLVYGDSVAKDTPVLLYSNVTKRVSYNTIENIVVCWSDVRGKEMAIPDQLYVWSDVGFTKIARIIRHKTTKQLFRIVTDRGIIDVTEDHSLLDKNAQHISPMDVQVGTELLHNHLSYTAPANNNSDLHVNPTLLGMFYHSGCCWSIAGTGGSSLFGWELGGNDYKKLEKIMREHLPVLPNVTYEIVSENNLHIFAFSIIAIGDIKALVETYRSHFYVDHPAILPAKNTPAWRTYMYNNKRVPDVILSSSSANNMLLFYSHATGGHALPAVTSTNKLVLATWHTLLFRLGFTSTMLDVTTTNNDEYIVRIAPSLHSQHSLHSQLPQNVVRKIIRLGSTDDYVYDFETENHHFSAGIGELVVHNTDSCMLKYNKVKNIGECFSVAKQMEIDINKIFPPPMYLEMEKIYLKYFLLTKKKYIGYIADKNGHVYLIDKKGVVMKRRDNCAYLRESYQTLIDLVMEKEPKWKVWEFLYTTVDNLVDGNVPIDKLVITKSLKDERSYKNTNLPHLVVARKMRNRGKYVAAGTRIPYIFVETPDAKDPQYKKVEDPEYYEANRDTVKLDLPYYFEKQLIVPFDEVIASRFNIKNVLKNYWKLRNKIDIPNSAVYFLPNFVVVDAAASISDAVEIVDDAQSKSLKS